MKTFKGKLFVWEDKSGRLNLSTCNTDESVMHDIMCFSFDIKTALLVMYDIGYDSTISIKFQCDDLHNAEILILQFLKGSKYEIFPVYKMEKK